MTEDLQLKLDQKIALQDLKLNALLEITSAINNNLSTEQLLNNFSFVLKQQLNFRRFVLFIDQEGWNCILKEGFKGKIDAKSNIPDLLRFKDITLLADSNSNLLKEFNVVLPVLHLGQPLAYLLLLDNQLKPSMLIDTDSHLSFAQTLTSIITVAIENKRLVKSNIIKEIISKDLEVASELQKLLFPSDLPSDRKMDVHAKYIQRHAIGGDYYDFIPLGDDEYILCIADVSGKGISAAMLMANFQATVRTLFKYQRFELAFLMEELNKKIVLNAKGEKFITFFIAHFNAHTRKLKYINAAHNYPILYMNRKILPLTDGCIGLGMLDELPSINVGSLTLDSKATLVLYTDGVVETEDLNGEAFGIDRLIKDIKTYSGLKMEDMNDIIFSHLTDWCGKGNYGDDTAIMSCKFF
jgi:sigma-B regulation protein RsbU (phosphoserine phosphatase)